MYILHTDKDGSDTLKQELIDKIALHMSEYGADLETIKTQLIIDMNDYEISKKETAVAIRNVDKNNEILKRFLISKTVKGCSDRTIKYYGEEIKKILEKINKSFDEVTTDDLRFYFAIRDRRDGVSKTTQDNELRILRSFYQFCYTEEYISKDPTAKIDKIKEQKKKKKAFTELEIEKMRAILRTNREKAIFEVLLSTGCRVSELVAIRKSDISSEKILINGKGNKQRYVYINAKASFAIEMYLRERKDENPYLFAGGVFQGTKQARENWYKNPESVSKSEHLETGSVESFIRRLGNRCGVKAYPHKFRRTCATMALRRGMPIEQVSKMLGHEQLSTTQIYLELDERDLEQAHRKYVV